MPRTLVHAGYLAALGLTLCAGCGSSGGDANGAAGDGLAGGVGGGSAGAAGGGATGPGGAGAAGKGAGGAAGKGAGGAAGKGAGGAAGKGAGGAAGKGAGGGSGQAGQSAGGAGAAQGGAGGSGTGAAGQSGGGAGSGAAGEAGASGAAAGGATGASGTSGGAGAAGAAGASGAAAFAAKLGAPHAGHFLVGMGNDGTNDGNDPAYNLGVTLDLHYHYLVGISTEGGWPTWNANPDYAGKRIQEAKSRGVVPMITYYAMASHGDGNIDGTIHNAAFMKVYFKDFLQLLDSVNAAGTPVVLQIEPDYWGYTEQKAIDAGGADKVPVELAAAGVADCQGLADTLVGLGHCYVKLARARAPMALLGFHASSWGSKMDVGGNTDPALDIGAEAQKSVDFFKAIGADQADFLTTDMSDRDAGCYEAGDPGVCNQKGHVYWDETNAALPNFHQQLVWIKAMTSGLGLPMMWWQVPFGVPSGTPGGAKGHFRDNRVHYMFSHLGEFVAAGGVGAVFGTGAGDQTFIDSDGNQFRDAVSAYFASPTPLP